MFAKLYGGMKDRESLESVLDELQEDLHKVGRGVSAEDRPVARRARDVRPRDGAGAARPPKASRSSHAAAELEPGVKEDNDNMPRISKMQIDLMVNSFAADFARVATLQFTNSVGQANGCAGSASRRAPRTLAQARQRQAGPGRS